MNSSKFNIFYKDPIRGYAPDTNDPHTADIPKNLPYLHYGSFDELKCLNYEVHFKDREDPGLWGDDLIACRHIALFLGLESLVQRDGKIPLHKVGSASAIEQNVGAGIERKFKNIFIHSTSVHALNNHDFAKFLKAQFGQMKKESAAVALAPSTPEQTSVGFSNGRKYTTKAVKNFLIVSMNHAMLLRLRLKQSNTPDGLVYVVNFYDPNKTGSMVRCEVSQIDELDAIPGTHTLAAFINPVAYEKTGIREFDDLVQIDWYDHYYSNGRADISIALEISEEASNTSAQVKQIDRTLASSQCSTSADLLSHFMHIGLPNDILKMSAELKEKRITPSAELLQANGASGVPGLFIAFQNGNAEAIRAWRTLLQLLPDKQQGAFIGQLLEKSCSLLGANPMKVALAEGHADAIRAFGEILKGLPESVRLSVMDRMWDAGSMDMENLNASGLAAALQHGWHDAIRAWGEFLDLLPDKGRDLFNRYREFGRHRGEKYPGLMAAVRNGNVDAISAWIGIMKGFSEEERGNLIISFISSRLSGFKIRDQPNPQGFSVEGVTWDAAVIRSAGSLLHGLTDNMRRKIVKEMLWQIDNQDKPCFFNILEETNTDALAAWNTLLGDLLDKELGVVVQALLTEFKKAGCFYVDVALEKGNAGAICLLQNWLNLLPEPGQTKTIKGLFADSVADITQMIGFTEALKYRYTGAIKAWSSLLQMLPGHERSALIKGILTQHRHAGRKALAEALQYGHAAAILSFGNVLEFLPNEDRREIIRDLLQLGNFESQMMGLDSAIQLGHADAIKAWSSLLETLSGDERGALIEDLLGQNLHVAQRCLVVALQNGHAAAIRAFKSLLQLLPDGKRAVAIKNLLQLRNGGHPMMGLDLALDKRHVDAIQAWSDLLPLLRDNERLQILTPVLTTRTGKIPVLHRALHLDDIGAIRAWGSLLEKLPGNESVAVLKDALTAKDSRGVPGLFIALCYGNADAIQSWGTLLELLPANKRGPIIRDMLAAKDATGVPGLALAVQGGHANAIDAWASLLQKLPDMERVALLKDVLAAKDSRGIPGLYMALQNGHADAIKAWGRLMLGLPEGDRVTMIEDLLAAKAINGVPGLYRALSNGHAGAIEAWGSLLQGVPKDIRATVIKELLTSNDATGRPGLNVALVNGQADAIKAWGRLLQYLPEEGRSIAIRDLLVARAPDGTPGLFAPLLRGHSRAVIEWGELLKLLPAAWFANDIAKLVIARHGNQTALDVIPVLDTNKVRAAWWSLQSFISEKKLSMAVSHVLHQNNAESKAALLKVLDDMRI